ncbi:outer membrane protein assembly factor BamB family protein [Pedobacter gandavensis]|uniref:PQQ-binding-like beta-propeller repeat protein n=1 Tax=Pedobacter gandavensis TaxID=2679963 RepID=A0ABR6ESS8_9SPHI|nr:PQQ-binding-like beta-propeller repeat protein [Pedobacter gandavensis]MBB2147869.1 PQQ-binding-like beta-propeller repeat protein [Pedobacter gandavensis]
MRLLHYGRFLLLSVILFACTRKQEPVKTNLIIATNNGDLYNVNLTTGKLQWQILDQRNNDELTYFTQHNQTILRAYSDKRILEIDKLNGKINWTFIDEVSANQAEYGYNFTGVSHLLFAQYPIVQGGSFIFGNSQGEFKSVDQKTRKINWTHQIHQPIYCSPAMFNNKVVINASSSIKTLNLANGSRIASFDLETPSFLAPVVNENLLYVVDEHGGVYCLNADLNLLWKHQPELDMFQQTKLNFSERDIFYGDTAMVSLKKKNGELNWRFVLPHQIDKKGKNNLLQSMEVIDDVIVANTPHYLLVIDQDDGKILKQKYFGNRETIGQLKYDNGFYYYLCSDNNLYKIDQDLKEETVVARNIRYQTDRAMDDTYLAFY